MNDWLYAGRPFTPEEAEGWHSFVYLIENLLDGRKYIGKKRLSSTRRLKQKGKKRRRVVRKTSDWGNYWSSCKELQEDIEKHGVENFRREILILCRSSGEASYEEARLQIENRVLIDDGWYNANIMLRVHRNHLTGMRNPARKRG